MSVVSKRLARLLARVVRAARSEWYATWRRRPIGHAVVLFESFGGNGASCNPEAIFRAVHRAHDLTGLTLVWALDRGAAGVMRAEFRGDRRVRVVRRGGLQYWRLLATAGTLVNNATFPPQFDRRPGQIYCNTWHGTPLKRMGLDEPDGAAAAANTIRNFLQATHLLSQNRYMTDTMYRSAYRLDGFATAEVLELGYPRNDRLRVIHSEAESIRTRLTAGGIALGADTRIVLIAPTWRGRTFSAPEDHSREIALTAEIVQAELDAAGLSARVVVKPHQAVMALARREPGLEHLLVPEDIPTNSLLAVADVLVSDFSSIAIDFLATGRPIVFSSPEDDTYSADRGLYVSVDEFPGRRSNAPAELAKDVAAALVDGVPAEFRARYRDWAERFVPDDDGHASERVVDRLFRHRTDPARPSIRLSADRRRPSILVHLGGMRANGITSSALNLLHALAGTGLDVTAVFPSSNRRAARMLRQRIDPRVRTLQRVGGMNGSKLAHLRRRLQDRRPARKIDPRAHRDDPVIAALWDDEWHRCFGNARFDAVVDFSGYAPFWATLLLHAPEPVVRSIWMHNDMPAEVERLVGGRPRMRRSLRGVIGMYDQFDRVVAVSESLRMHNAAALEHLLGVRTVAARNIIDDQAVLVGSTAGLDTLFTDDEPRPWLARLEDPSLQWFVCVGRLSPEKNHERLLTAFALVYAGRPDTRLLIVGDGYLRPILERLARDLEIADAVVFAGAVPNPYPLMARATCVVVSSDHEGQPMVVLEAAVLGRPIVATRFDSARDALPGDDMLIVDKNARALADGMRLVLHGEVHASRLDATEYNSAALGEFLDAVLGAEPPRTAQPTGGSVPVPR